MKALITGITGQDGSYLAELLLSRGYQVFGLSRDPAHIELSPIQHLKGKVELFRGDLLDSHALLSTFEQIRPDEVYNFAGPGFVGASWNYPIETADYVAIGVSRLLETIRKVSPRTRFYQASSSEMFGDAISAPQNEQSLFRPRTPYGTSKAYAHWMTANYRNHYGMHASSGILYNHESSRRRPEFVTRKITIGAARIKMGLDQELRLGNLDAVRDWGFSGDYVKAMWLMLQQDKADDYVVSTGEPHTVREFVDLAFSRLDLDYREYVKVDESFYRPNEAVPLIGDSSKARKILNWEPQVSFKALVQMMVDADWAALQKAKPLSP